VAIALELQDAVQWCSLVPGAQEISRMNIVLRLILSLKIVEIDIGGE
jgi:hypothetical protein